MDADDSSSASAPAREADEDSKSYDELLSTLDVAIEEARRKIENGRVYEPENERARQGWIRVLAYSINTRRQVMNDRDLEEMQQEIEELKEALELE